MSNLIYSPPRQAHLDGRGFETHILLLVLCIQVPPPADLCTHRTHYKCVNYTFYITLDKELYKTSVLNLFTDIKAPLCAHLSASLSFISVCMRALLQTG